MVIGRDGDVALVEEAMDIRTEEQSVRHLVETSFCERPNMSSLENREGMFEGTAQARR